MARIFISYRRDDGRYAASWIQERLDREEDVTDIRTAFRDSELEAGEDFHERLDCEVKSCDVFVAVIGPDWRGGEGSEARILEPNDWVGREVASAIKHKKHIVPVLLKGAEPLREADLLPDQALLARRNAVVLEDRNHLEKLVGDLLKHLHRVDRARAWVAGLNKPVVLDRVHLPVRTWVAAILLACLLAPIGFLLAERSLTTTCMPPGADEAGETEEADDTEGAPHDDSETSSADDPIPACPTEEGDSQSTETAPPPTFDSSETVNEDGSITTVPSTSTVIPPAIEWFMWGILGVTGLAYVRKTVTPHNAVLWPTVARTAIVAAALYTYGVITFTPNGADQGYRTAIEAPLSLLLLSPWLIVGMAPLWTAPKSDALADRVRNIKRMRQGLTLVTIISALVLSGGVLTAAAVGDRGGEGASVVFTFASFATFVLIGILEYTHAALRQRSALAKGEIGDIAEEFHEHAKKALVLDRSDMWRNLVPWTSMILLTAVASLPLY